MSKTVTATLVCQICKKSKSPDSGMTCSVGDPSPHLGDYHVGDRVKVLCTDGVLTAISRPE